MIEVPYFMPASAPKPPRSPHPSGYQLAKANNQKMLALINAISGRLDDAVLYQPQVSDDIFAVRGMIAEWRNNG